VHRSCPAHAPDTTRESQQQLFMSKQGTQRAVRLAGAHSLSGAQLSTAALFNCVTIINTEILHCVFIIRLNESGDLENFM